MDKASPVPSLPDTTAIWSQVAIPRLNCLCAPAISQETSSFDFLCSDQILCLSLRVESDLISSDLKTFLEISPAVLFFISFVK